MGGSSETTQAQVSERWLYPRLRAFAIALTGSMRGGAGLAQAAMSVVQDAPDAGHGQAGLMLNGYQAVHALWMQRTTRDGGATQGRADPRCFALPANTSEGAARCKGLAQVIADLPAQQRATLLLIYGEGLSYDEVAEIFDTTVQVVMTRAVRGHVAVEHWMDRRDGSGPARDGGTGGEEKKAQDNLRHAEYEAAGRVA